MGSRAQLWTTVHCVFFFRKGSSTHFRQSIFRNTFELIKIRQNQKTTFAKFVRLRFKRRIKFQFRLLSQFQRSVPGRRGGRARRARGGPRRALKGWERMSKNVPLIAEFGRMTDTRAAVDIQLSSSVQMIPVQRKLLH